MTTVLKELPPLHIHPILWFFIILSMVTGTFTEISIIFTIVIIHELGHYFAARGFKWRIRKISLWVFGGVMETDEYGSKPIKQEMLITLAGPIQHIWIYGGLFILSNYTTFPESVIDLAWQYNTMILLFNLLPIWPLDGGKLMNLLYSSVFAYKKAHAITIISSIAFALTSAIVFFSLYRFTLSTALLLSFILWENRVEWKQRYYVFIRFLIKRHKDANISNKVTPIVVHPDTSLLHVFSKFKRNHHHHVHVKEGTISSLVDEQECLQAYFGLKQYRATAGEVLSRE